MLEHDLQLVLDAIYLVGADFMIAILIVISLVLLVFACQEQLGTARPAKPDSENIE